jgi:hypothetical protein
MALGQPPFAKAVSSPPLYISLKTQRVEMRRKGVRWRRGKK